MLANNISANQLIFLKLLYFWYTDISVIISVLLIWLMHWLSNFSVFYVTNCGNMIDLKILLVSLILLINHSYWICCCCCCCCFSDTADSTDLGILWFYWYKCYWFLHSLFQFDLSFWRTTITPFTILLISLTWTT